MSSTSAESRKQWLERIVVLSILVLCVIRVFSLFTTPVIDSYRWWGDESWLMTEFMTQVREGVFRHPYAFGSSLEHSSGSLLGSMWLTAGLYGGTASLFHTIQPEVVHVGRVLSYLLSIGLLFLSWKLLRQVNVSSISALVATSLLVSSRGFFYMSHSARYDILTAAAILALIAFILSLARKPLTFRSILFLGALFVAGVTASIHVVLLTGLPVLAYLIRSGSWKRPQLIGAFLIGYLSIAVPLLLIQTVTSDVSLFGSRHGSTFLSNVHDIPALRPFSRSVQTANLIQKLKTAWELAPVVLIITTIFGLSILLRWRKDAADNSWSNLLVLFTTLVIVSWVLFESAAPTSYLIYVLPLASILCGIGLDRFLFGREKRGTWLQIVLPALVIMLLIQSAVRDWNEGKVGENISQANEDVINKALDSIHGDPMFHQGANGRIVAFNPAIHRLLAEPGTHPMTTHFIEFPVSNATTHDVLASMNAKYLLLYRSPLKPDYMREVGSLTNEAAMHGTLIFRSIRILTDIGRSYQEPKLEYPDTLEVYRLMQ